MKRSTGAPGFSNQIAPIASSRLIDAVVASLALGASSLCLAVAMLSIRVCQAMPF